MLQKQNSMREITNFFEHESFYKFDLKIYVEKVRMNQMLLDTFQIKEE